MKALIIVLAVILVIGVFLMVVLPFILGYHPQSTTSATKEEKQSSSPQAKEIGVFVSQDGGVSWEKKEKFEGKIDMNAYSVLDFEFGPDNSSVIFLGTKGGGLWKTEDNGDNWKQIKDENGVLKDNSQVYKIAFSRSAPKEMYLAVFQETRGRVLKSTDGGKSFREVYFTPLEKFGVFDIAVDEANNVFIVTGQGGFFVSRDRGKTWQVVRWFKDGLIKLVVNPASPQVMYVLTPKGSIFKTTDRGGSWVDITESFSKFDGAKTNQKVFIDSRASFLYLASNYGALKSVSGGNSWQRLPLIIPPEVLPVLSIAVDPFNSRVIYVSASNQLYKSEDVGESWSVRSSPSPKKLIFLKINPRNSNMLYAVFGK